MAELGLNIKQQGYSVSADGSGVRSAQGTRSGALYTAGLYDQWLRAGRVFEGHFATEGGFATIENNTAVDLTEPLLLLDSVSGITLVPIKIKVAPAVVWETGDEYILYTSDTVGYSAGGADMDVRKMSQDESGGAIGSVSTSLAAAKDGDTAMTSVALTNPRIIDFGHFLTGGLHKPYEYNILKGDPMFMIAGAGSMQLMISRTTTTIECAYSIVWAELDKQELVNR